MANNVKLPDGLFRIATTAIKTKNFLFLDASRDEWREGKKKETGEKDYRLPPISSRCLKYAKRIVFGRFSAMPSRTVVHAET